MIHLILSICASGKTKQSKSDSMEGKGSAAAVLAPTLAQLMHMLMTVKVAIFSKKGSKVVRFNYYYLVPVIVFLCSCKHWGPHLLPHF